MVSIYDAFDHLLQSILPKDCRVFRINMPFQQMQSLTRETAKLCIWLITSDVVRVNTSGPTPVHEVSIDISVFGTLEEVNSMSNTITEVLVGSDVESLGWHFVLRHRIPGKQDIWEPQIQDKRIYLQLTGIVIEPDTGTAG